MLKNKLVWFIQMGSTLGLYVVLLLLIFMDQMRAIAAGVLVFLILLHLYELKTALPIGRQRGLPDRKIIALTLVFGYTWWVPLKHGIFTQ